MAKIRVTGWIETDTLHDDDVDLLHETGHSQPGRSDLRDRPVSAVSTDRLKGAEPLTRRSVMLETEGGWLEGLDAAEERERLRAAQERHADEAVQQAEIADLTRQQAADDASDSVVRQRFAEKRVLSLDDTHGRTVDAAGWTADASADPAEIDHEPKIDRQAIVREAIASMTGEFRQAYRLVYVQRMTVRQAAEVAGCSKGSIQHRLDKVKQKAQAALDALA